MDGLLIFFAAATWLTILALSVAVFALARQIGLLHERVSPAGALLMNPKHKPGDAAPQLKAPSLAREFATIGGVQEKSTLIFFLSPSCPVCKSLLPVVQKSQDAERGWLNVLYASDGDGDGHLSLAREYGIDPAQYIVSEALGRAFAVAKLPYAVLIDPDGRIASLGLVNSREHLESLFNAQESGVVSIQEHLRQRRDNAATAIGA